MDNDLWQSFSKATDAQIQLRLQQHQKKDILTTPSLSNLNNLWALVRDSIKTAAKSHIPHHESATSGRKLTPKHILDIYCDIRKTNQIYHLFNNKKLNEQLFSDCST